MKNELFCKTLEQCLGHVHSSMFLMKMASAQAGSIEMGRSGAGWKEKGGGDR